MKKEAKEFPSLTTNRIHVRSARSGLASILSHHRQNLNRKPVVLMPSYIGWSPNEGSGLMDPVLDSGFLPIFYRLDDFLQPNFEELCKLVAANPQSVLLVVHFFGMRVEIPNEIINLANEYSVTFVQDWAHDLSQIDKEIGTFPNHYSIYSLHKWTASGAGGFISGNYLDIEELETESMDLADSNVFMRSNLDMIAELRWSNFSYAENLLTGLERLTFFYADSKNFSCPLNIPMMAKSNRDRHELYSTLVHNGIVPTALYHILVPQLNKPEFSESVDISNRIINLPIHQDCTRNQIDIMIDVIMEWEKQSVGLE
jgi:dTDP-4-amino-4,6-dideoxygalactose transaminase